MDCYPYGYGYYIHMTISITVTERTMDTVFQLSTASEVDWRHLAALSTVHRAVVSVISEARVWGDGLLCGFVISRGQLALSVGLPFR